MSVGGIDADREPVSRARGLLQGLAGQAKARARSRGLVLAPVKWMGLLVLWRSSEASSK